MPKLKVSDSKMRERGYFMSFVSSPRGTTKTYRLDNFLITVCLRSDGSCSSIITNNDVQKHDIDLDELEYLEEIYK